MIQWKMEQILPKPVMKMLDRLTVKKLARFFCFKVDKSIEDRLVKDVGIELGRNVFVGNEPYVQGTPIYAAMEKLLKRLRPITYGIQRKMGKKYPVLSNMNGFVLSLIGDEKQRDYEATVPIHRDLYS